MGLPLYCLGRYANAAGKKVKCCIAERNVTINASEYVYQCTVCIGAVRDRRKQYYAGVFGEEIATDEEIRYLGLNTVFVDIREEVWKVINC